MSREKFRGGTGRVSIGIGEGWRRTADPSATFGACDFFDLACSLWLESSEEHLPTSIAGGPSAGSGQALRLRAISRPLCDRSARRFAQDDGFVGGEKHPVSYAENTKRSKKSQALGMTRGGWGVPLGLG